LSAHVKERLAKLGIDARIDHRTLERQGVKLAMGGSAMGIGLEDPICKASRTNRRSSISSPDGPSPSPICRSTPKPRRWRRRSPLACRITKTLRDPSHTSALTLEQLRALGIAADLAELLVESYRLEARLHTLSDPEDMVALEEMFDADIASGHDWIGVGAWRDADGIAFSFPITIIAWSPAAA
jgi:hypothetical protein